MDPFCYLCFMFALVMQSCLFIVALMMLFAWKGLISLLSCVLGSLVFLSPSHMVSWSSEVLDCIDY